MVEHWQTVLFVPADRPDMLEKAGGRGADAVLVDLEDAIALDAKAAARAMLGDRLRAARPAGPAALAVRVNAVGEGADEDLAALDGAELDAVVLPKVSGTEEIRRVRAALDESVALIPQVESVAAILGLRELAFAPGIAAIAFGGEDFCVDLGVARSPESVELLVPRALVALHARAAGLPAIDTVYTAIADAEGLAREARLARQLGFSGKLLIHPAQIDPVREVFTPTADAVAWARRVLDSGTDGRGVRVVDGKMVDAPVAAQAERILARSR